MLSPAVRGIGRDRRSGARNRRRFLKRGRAVQRRVRCVLDFPAAADGPVHQADRPPRRPAIGRNGSEARSRQTAGLSMSSRRVTRTVYTPFDASMEVRRAGDARQMLGAHCLATAGTAPAGTRRSPGRHRSQTRATTAASATPPGGTAPVRIAWSALLARRGHRRPTPTFGVLRRSPGGEQRTSSGNVTRTPTTEHRGQEVLRRVGRGRRAIGGEGRQPVASSVHRESRSRNGRRERK